MHIHVDASFGAITSIAQVCFEESVLVSQKAKILTIKVENAYQAEIIAFCEALDDAPEGSKIYSDCQSLILAIQKQEHPNLKIQEIQKILKAKRLRFKWEPRNKSACRCYVDHLAGCAVKGIKPVKWKQYEAMYNRNMNKYYNDQVKCKR